MREKCIDSLNEKVWLQMLRDRNDTTHIYNQDAAERLVDKILNQYMEVFSVLEIKVEERYGREILSSLI